VPPRSLGPRPHPYAASCVVTIALARKQSAGEHDSRYCTAGRELIDASPLLRTAGEDFGRTALHEAAAMGSHVTEEPAEFARAPRCGSRDEQSATRSWRARRWVGPAAGGAPTPRPRRWEDAA
jgi:hypothetical protein